MSNALVHQRRSGGRGSSGIVPAVASAIVPGVGQLLNGQGTKALGVFLVWLICGASFLGWIPLVGTLAGLIATGAWVYGVGDAFLTARKK